MTATTKIKGGKVSIRHPKELDGNALIELIESIERLSNLNIPLSILIDPDGIDLNHHSLKPTHHD